MLGEILQPKYQSQVPHTGKVQIFVYKFRRMLYTYRLKNRVLKSSLSSRIWTSLVAHLRKPETIFERGEK